MAKLILKGDTADVEITSNVDVGANQTEENGYGGWIGRCVLHASRPNCMWMEHYDTLDDATQYAADHADYGRK